MLTFLKKKSDASVDAAGAVAPADVASPAPSVMSFGRKARTEKPLKAVIEFVDGIDPKTAVGYIEAKANDELKLAEICSYDLLKFKTDKVDGYFIEIHQGGSRRSHLKAIRDLCLQDDGARGFFEIAGRRVIVVQMTEGRPDALILSESKSGGILNYTPDDLTKENMVPLAVDRPMKAVVKANSHLVWAGVAGMVIGVLSLIIAGVFYETKFADARHVRSLTPDMMPHLQWNRVARPAPGRYVTKLSYENGQWSQETAASPLPAQGADEAETPMGETSQ